MNTISSTCLIMNENDSIRSVVKAMVDGEFDYALLKNNDNRLRGIFTQTQCLRYLEDIVDQRLLDAPILKVMSSPVKTLPLHLCHTAPEFFKTHGVYHAPIVNHNADTQRDEVVGVLTSANYVDAVANKRKLPPIFGVQDSLTDRKTLGIASPDGSLHQLIETIYEGSDNTDVERIRFAHLQTKQDLERACNQFDALILDLEGAPERFWLPAVEFVLKHPGSEYLALVISPDFPMAKKNAIAAIEKTGVLQVFEKPLNIEMLIRDVQRFWARIEK